MGKKHNNNEEEEEENNDNDDEDDNDSPRCSLPNCMHNIIYIMVSLFHYIVYKHSNTD